MIVITFFTKYGFVLHKGICASLSCLSGGFSWFCAFWKLLDSQIVGTLGLHLLLLLLLLCRFINLIFHICKKGACTQTN